ncbi:enoyl-CoA hydratase/isomerase family protein [Phreatobacter sp. AB_2022a]|uniref:enoyl-CoA hydratase/isomerase family protein n=1 Tax=Phreatobacter sp. AB_2022a TaxID=3003134 RepID=UPI0022872CBA|nr:enoyl-CoA hydratase-related protein [Phreatobacter sp. AB_2022a]MCZ0736192.1 enoyl-CoA hydratase-related protein [Phreatobacter sp. AB_2022a]
MSRYDHYQTIKAERRGRILTISLDRPNELNAVNAQLHRELSRIFLDVRDDAEADIIVLTGEGRAFCAGGDIDWMQSTIDRPEEFEVTGREAKDIVFSQIDLDKPLICRLNGHATGLGASLALLCDIIIASDKAKIGDPHVSVGLVAGDGGAFIWPQLIGHAKAKHYLLTGDLMTAGEAERIGLITKVVAPEDLDSEVYGLAERLAKGALKAINWTKITANLPLKALFHAHFDAGLAYETMSNLTADHQEAVNAFRDKRKPVFKGR